MENEGVKTNLWELSEEIREAGFPWNVLKNLQLELERIPRGPISLPFEKGLDRPGLTGKIYLEPEQFSTNYFFSQFDVNLGSDAEVPIRHHTFDRMGGYEVSLQEAVNLMEGVLR